MTRTLFLLLLLTASAFANDVVHLRDGRKLEGKVTVDGDAVVIEQKLGSVRVSADQVLRIVAGPDTEAETERMRAELAEGDADQRYRFGVHLRERGQAAKARRAFEGVLKLDPEHAGARAALGYVHHDGYWILAKDYYRSQGLVQHKGEWITPAERSARVQLERAERDKRESDATEAKLAELRAKIDALTAEREAMRERREEVREATREAYGEYAQARAKANAWIDSAQGAWGWRSGAWWRGTWGGWWGGGLVPPPILPAPLPPGINPPRPGWQAPLRPPTVFPPRGRPTVVQPTPVAPPKGLQPGR